MTTPGSGATGEPDAPIVAVLARMSDRLTQLPDRLAHQRVFLATYQRTTRAVGKAVAQGAFEDPGWVERWDVVFADLYLAALDAELTEGARAPGPWRLAFAAPPEVRPLRQVLLGINAHVNFDLPQALLAVIDDDDFADPDVMARRRRDHERIDDVLSSRIVAEQGELVAAGERVRTIDRLLAPLNRRASRRFLRQARQKVWHNTLQLQAARVAGPDVYTARLAELEALSAAKIADLLRPGQVLLRLAVTGFGVQLPAPQAGL
ncbi:MAG TPA: DUF5995 family protein [Actinotalea sp.]